MILARNIRDYAELQAESVELRLARALSPQEFVDSRKSMLTAIRALAAVATDQPIPVTRYFQDERNERRDLRQFQMATGWLGETTSNAPEGDFSYRLAHDNRNRMARKWRGIVEAGFYPRYDSASLMPGGSLVVAEFTIVEQASTGSPDADANPDEFLMRIHDPSSTGEIGSRSWNDLQVNLEEIAAELPAQT